MLIPAKSHFQVDRCNSQVSIESRDYRYHPSTWLESAAVRRGGGRITDWPQGTGKPQAHIGWGRTIGQHCGWSAHLMSALTRLWTVIFLVSYRGILKRPHLHCQADAVGYQRLPGGRNICPRWPLLLRYATVVCFVASIRASGMWATASVKQTNKQSIDSKHGATGGNYPTHNRRCFRAVASLDSRKSRNSFPGSWKNIETLESC